MDSKLCHACLESSNLTEDHIFPKSISLDENHGLKKRAGSILSSKRFFAQNGLKKRTLCAKCNNDLLGSKYDPALAHLIDEAKKYWCNKIQLPDHAKIIYDIKLNKVVRAIAGHILAATPVPSDSPLHQQIRSFFLNPESVPPETLYIYTWRFTKPQQQVSPAFAINRLGNRERIDCLGAFYKSTPLGFVFSIGDPNYLPPSRKIINISNILTSDPDKLFRLHLTRIEDSLQNWPLIPRRDEIVLLDESQALTQAPHVNPGKAKEKYLEYK